MINNSQKLSPQVQIIKQFKTWIDNHLIYFFQLAKVTDFFQQLDKFRKEQIGSVKVIHESMKIKKLQKL